MRARRAATQDSQPLAGDYVLHAACTYMYWLAEVVEGSAQPLCEYAVIVSETCVKTCQQAAYVRVTWRGDIA